MKSVHPLRLWRDAQCLQLDEAAVKFKTTAASISRIERGLQRPGRDLEERIVKLTGLTRDDLAWKPSKRRSQASQEVAA